MPCQCRFEVGSPVTIIVIHLSHVLDEFCLRLAVSSQPVLIDLAVGIVIFAVYMILVDQTISVKLVVTIQINTVTTRVYLFVDIG